MGTGEHVVGGNGIGESLQGLRIGTLQEGVGALLKANATLLEAQGEPVMLIEANAGGEGEVGAAPYEYLSPAGVLDVKIVLLSTPLHFQMPTVVFSDGGHDSGGLARFDDGHDVIGSGTSEVGIDKVIATA